LWCKRNRVCNGVFSKFSLFYAFIGKWLRDKIGAADGEFITLEMLQKFGSTHVVFKKYPDNIYVLEFEPEDK
jgi:hypothetical protein